MKITSNFTQNPWILSLAQMSDFHYIPLNIKKFSNNELSVTVPINIIDENIILLCDFSKSINETIIEIIFIIDALKNKAVRKITLLAPYLPYSRQDRPLSDNDSIGAKIFAKLIESTNIDSIITLDIHSSLCESYFSIPIINLSPAALFAEYIIAQDVVVVSPDIGSILRAQDLANFISTDLAIINKIRENDNISMEKIAGIVANKDCVLIDDLIDSGRTLSKASFLLKELGARSIEAFVTHCLANKKTMKIIDNSPITRVTITDSLNQTCFSDKFRIIPIDLLLKKVIISDYLTKE